MAPSTVVTDLQYPVIVGLKRSQGNYETKGFSLISEHARIDLNIAATMRGKHVFSKTFSTAIFHNKNFPATMTSSFNILGLKNVHPSQPLHDRI